MFVCRKGLNYLIIAQLVKDFIRFFELVLLELYRSCQIKGGKRVFTVLSINCELFVTALILAQLIVTKGHVQINRVVLWLCRQDFLITFERLVIVRTQIVHGCKGHLVWCFILELLMIRLEGFFV